MSVTANTTPVEPSQTPAPYDYLGTWETLRGYLDTVSVARMAEHCAIDLKTIGGWTGPAVCPRHECRSYRVFMIADCWQCPQCGAGGGSAALFAARTVGWSHDQSIDPEAKAILLDFNQLAREAIFCGLIDSAPENVRNIYLDLPGFAEWTPAQRGIYEGQVRAERLRAFARELLKTQMNGISVLRAAWAWSTCFCRPPLTASEVAQIVESAR